MRSVTTPGIASRVVLCILLCSILCVVLGVILCVPCPYIVCILAGVAVVLHYCRAFSPSWRRPQQYSPANRVITGGDGEYCCGVYRSGCDWCCATTRVTCLLFWNTVGWIPCAVCCCAWEKPDEWRVCGKVQRCCAITKCTEYCNNCRDPARAPPESVTESESESVPGSELEHESEPTDTK